MNNVKKVLFPALLATLAFGTTAAAISFSSGVRADAATTGGISLTLTDGIAVNYIVDYSAGEGITPVAKFDSVVDSLDRDVEGVSVGDNQWKFSYTAITPQYIDQTFSVSIDGNVFVEEYSVEQYCNDLQNKTAADLKISQVEFNQSKLVAQDIIYYGQAAKVYRFGEGEVTATSGTEFAAEDNMTLDGEYDAENRIAKATVVFDYKPAIRFTIAKANEEATVTVDGVDVTADLVAVDGGYTYTVSDIYAVDFDKQYEVVLTNGANVQTLKYSVFDYAARMQNSSNERMRTLAKALWCYGQGADTLKAYGDKIETSTPLVTLSATEEVTLSATKFPNDYVLSRQDLVAAGRFEDGKYGVETGNNRECIYGFVEGTKFVFEVEAPQAMRAGIRLIGASDAANCVVGETMRITVNAEDATGVAGSLTGFGAAPYWDWHSVNIGVFDFTAGINTVEIEILKGTPNLVGLVFDPTPDAGVTLTPNEKAFKAAYTFEKDLVLSNPDAVRLGYITDGSFGVDAGDENRIYWFRGGTKFTFEVNATETITAQMNILSYAGGTVDDIYDVYIDGVACDLSMIGNMGTSKEDRLRTIGGFTFEKGKHIVEIYVNAAPDMYGVEFLPVTLHEVSVGQRTYVQANTFDNDYVITRNDFIPHVGEGNYATDGTKIYGFVAGTKFFVYVNVPYTVKEKISLYAHGGGGDTEFATAIKTKVNGAECSVSGTIPGSSLAAFELGAFELKKGINLVEIEIIGGGPNLGGLEFAPDTTLSATESVKVSATEFRAIEVTTRQDFVNAGILKVGEYKTETGNGETCICGFVGYSKFETTVSAAEDLQNIAIQLVGANDNPTVATIDGNFKISIDGVEVTGIEGSILGTTHDGIPNYWDWQTVTLTVCNLAQGEHTVTIEVLGGGNHPNLVALVFNPNAA